MYRQRWLALGLHFHCFVWCETLGWCTRAQRWWYQGHSMTPWHDHQSAVVKAWLQESKKQFMTDCIKKIQFFFPGKWSLLILSHKLATYLKEWKSLKQTKTYQRCTPVCCLICVQANQIAEVWWYGNATVESQSQVRTREPFSYEPWSLAERVWRISTVAKSKVPAAALKTLLYTTFPSERNKALKPRLTKSQKSKPQ